MFRSIHRNKSGVAELRSADLPMSYSRTREVVLQKIEEIGLDKSLFGLHSLRAGAATESANRGTKDCLFKRYGRWKSETAKDGYIKDSKAARLSVSQNLGL